MSKFEIKGSDGSLPPELIPGNGGLSFLDDIFVEEIYLKHVKVVGYYYLSEEEQEYYRAAGDPETAVQLKPDPDNAYDHYAIQVLDMNDHHIGWVPRTENHIFARLLDAGKKLVARASDDGNALDGDLIISIFLAD